VPSRVIHIYPSFEAVGDAACHVTGVTNVGLVYVASGSDATSRPDRFPTQNKDREMNLLLKISGNKT
jgi:hypothetical protein